MDHNTSYSQREHELIPGFLRGYRKWGWCEERHTYSWSGSHLRSLTRSYHWASGRQTASCAFFNEGAHNLAPVPAKGCTCGFYATYNGIPRDFTGLFEGSVKAEGRIILGQRGFRAQFVTVEALCFSASVPIAHRDFIAHQVSELYRVPFFNSRDELLEAFPPQDVSHLIQVEVEPVFEWFPMVTSGTFTIRDASGKLTVHAPNGTVTFIALPPEGPPGADPASG
jgi:hypothetical protein